MTEFKKTCVKLGTTAICAVLCGILCGLLWRCWHVKPRHVDSNSAEIQVPIPMTLSSIGFDMSKVVDENGRVLTLNEIILDCESHKHDKHLREGVDTFYEVLFRYEAKQVERTCRELYEFLAGGKQL